MIISIRDWHEEEITTLRAGDCSCPELSIKTRDLQTTGNLVADGGCVFTDSTHNACMCGSIWVAN